MSILEEVTTWLGMVLAIGILSGTYPSHKIKEGTRLVILCGGFILYSLTSYMLITYYINNWNIYYIPKILVGILICILAIPPNIKDY